LKNEAASLQQQHNSELSGLREQQELESGKLKCDMDVLKQEWADAVTKHEQEQSSAMELVSQLQQENSDLQRQVIALHRQTLHSNDNRNNTINSRNENKELDRERNTLPSISQALSSRHASDGSDMSQQSTASSTMHQYRPLHTMFSVPSSSTLFSHVSDASPSTANTYQLFPSQSSASLSLSSLHDNADTNRSITPTPAARQKPPYPYR